MRIAQSAPQLPPNVEVFHEGEGTVQGRVGNLLVGVTRQTGGGMENAAANHQRMLELYPAGFAYLAVAAGGLSMPSPEIRQKMQQTAARFGQHYLCHAVVLEGEGLWLSSMRMVASTMMVAVPKDHARRIFATARDATRWAHTESGREAHFDVAEANAAIEDFKARLGPQQARG